MLIYSNKNFSIIKLSRYNFVDPDSEAHTQYVEIFMFNQMSDVIRGVGKVEIRRCLILKAAK